ncbi:hypothetical protein IGS59_20835 [Janthinobacterium sp. GW460P]|uniref:hypothetical protein n=1 Tax=unclassified Janthinobacterium TaxID=2610881 RepID=UPI00111C8159|nr:MULTISPECIES: hypothetical protein [unclassified Janthinobacterium]MCC7704692.1 hypothetical protein [Janthinobacterium sp. GW460P]MCC7710194.1 hypothetical protein [Janthinobacterium sp. GW460W]
MLETHLNREQVIQVEVLHFRVSNRVFHGPPRFAPRWRGVVIHPVSAVHICHVGQLMGEVMGKTTAREGNSTLKKDYSAKFKRSIATANRIKIFICTLAKIH